jgi:hypothetical protein
MTPRHREAYMRIAIDGTPRTTVEIGELLGIPGDLPGVNQFLRNLKTSLVIERSVHRLMREDPHNNQGHAIWTLITKTASHEETRKAAAQSRHRRDSTRKRRYR